MKKHLLALSIAGLCAGNLNAATPSVEEMWEIIQQQQSEIQRLKSQLTKTDERLEVAEVKVEATADAVEKAPSQKYEKLADWVEKTSIGGYGEIHYNNQDDESGGNNDKDEIDLHRFVLFFGHQFNDKVRFFSELEVEHSLTGGGGPGEVELEQAYIEWDFAANHRAKAGVFLIPVGILNETHEPDTFYGTERNSVEKNIIPATWWEAGAGINGEIAPGLNYDLAFHSGLFIDAGAGDYKIRDGRQKAAEAKADDPAFTARLKYTGIQGLELAATLQYQTDVYQSENFNGDEIDATLFEAHAAYQNGPFALRALYAHWDLDDGINSVKSGADEQEGFYIEPSFRLNDKLGFFARYSEWDNQAGASNDTEYDQLDLGLNYWLTPHVVFKLDYQDQDAPNGKTELDGVNLGLGWSF
ncbi:MAG: porin [Pseudomonadales bacterium]|nr:porin [Pseudomonadales bacterium]